MTMMIQKKLPNSHHFPRIDQQTHFHFIRKSMNPSPNYSINVSSSGNGRFSLVSSNAISDVNREKVRRLVHEFNPNIPIEEAWTPPSSWYMDPDFYSLELHQVFYRGWHPVGYTEQIKEPHQYFTGRLGSIEYVVCRDERGSLRAFHNVCRHHASLVASGTGKRSCFVCPYHGWTYGLDGALMKATRLTGIRNFKVNEMGLIPLKAAIWGPFVLINSECGEPFNETYVGDEWLGNTAKILSNNGVDSSLVHVCRRTYDIHCNWKVFCDNYLDGGYHVPYAHKGLALSLQLDSYSTKIYGNVSIQSCSGSVIDNRREYVRLGTKALYAFVYPNFMVNRYGPWMDTNLVLPMGPRKCQVVFDYFLDASLKILEKTMIATDVSCQDNNTFIEKSLEDSEKVQIEDIVLSENVQLGLESPAYNVGRYSPNVEMAMHHFHCMLYQNLCESLDKTEIR